MIDATSVASAAAVLVGACSRLSRYIYNFLNKIEHEETAVRVLKIEIDSLSGVLGSISVKFSDPSTASTVLQSFTGYEDELWGSVKRSMTDCEVTLRTLEQVLRSVKQGGIGLARRATIQTRLEQRWEEIGVLKQHVTSYHKAMELALQLITVYVRLLLSSHQLLATTRRQPLQKFEHTARRAGFRYKPPSRIISSAARNSTRRQYPRHGEFGSLCERRRTVRVDCK